jgi:alcohol dehydrogenase class IV
VVAGVAQEGDSPAEGARKFIAAISAMNAAMQIPTALPELRGEDIPALAARAEREANPLYPVPRLMSTRELERIYRRVAE